MEAFQQAHRIPKEERRGGDRWGQLVKTGSLVGCHVELYKTQSHSGETRFYLWIPLRELESNMVYDEDSELIERYVTVQHGPIQWEANADDVRVTGAGS